MLANITDAKLTQIDILINVFSNKLQNNKAVNEMLK